MSQSKPEMSPKPQITLRYVSVKHLFYAFQAIEQFVKDYPELWLPYNHYTGFVETITDIDQLRTKPDYDFYVKCTANGNILLEQV